MECIECKQESKLAVNTSNCKLCVSCYHKHDPSDSDEIKNDVLFHIFDNRMRTTYKSNATVCEIKYGEPAVINARDYLLSKLKAKFDNIDEELIKQLATDRRSSSGANGRTKAAATICDIHTVLQALEAEIHIIPANVEQVMKINPEALVPESVVSRIEEVERKLEILENENTTLREELQTLSSLRPSSEPLTGDLESEQVEDVSPTAKAEEENVATIAATAIDKTSPIASASGNVEPDATSANETVAQSYAAVVGGGAAAGAPVEGGNSGASRKTGSLKHKRNLDAQNIAATAAAQAVLIGLPMNEAVNVGAAAASQLVKAYSESNKQNRSGNKAGTSVVAVGQHQPTLTSPNLPSPHVTQRQSGQWNTAGKPKHRKRLALTVPYLKGTGTAIDGVSIARTKPQYLQNEALVISGLPTDINGTRLRQYINSKAKTNIELLHVHRLDREYARWAAIVVELSKENYTLLSNPDFWEQGVYIRPWTGQRHWREKRKFMTGQERQNSARRTWED